MAGILATHTPRALATPPLKRTAGGAAPANRSARCEASGPERTSSGAPPGRRDWLERALDGGQAALAGVELDGEFPVLVPPFMEEIVEQLSICARKSSYVDHQSGVSARFSIANYRTMIASARQRAIRLGERPAVPRISDLGHLYASSVGKLELLVTSRFWSLDLPILTTLARTSSAAEIWCFLLVSLKSFGVI